MGYYIYELTFLGPVHFGATDNGGDLEQVSMNYSSDQLFSALCNEAATSPELLKGLLEAVESGQVVFSSLFPYARKSDDTQYYLPKPIYREVRKEAAKAYNSIKKELKQVKQLKKSSYVRCKDLNGGLDNSAKVLMTGAMDTFAENFVSVSVNVRDDSGPYYVGSYQFHQDTGLYCIVKIESDEMKRNLDMLFNFLGYTGIGGKRSSGYGKFQVHEGKGLALDKNGKSDKGALYALLTKEGEFSMNISSLVPQSQEVPTVKEGLYKLRKHSGFVWSPATKQGIKRDSYFSVEEGSLFNRPIEGVLISMNVVNVPHPIYKNGKALFVGVKRHG